jgi:uncharacterized protein YwgA
MSQSSNLVYSNDLCSAFMAAIVRSYEEHVGERHYLGRTAMQKLVYFAKVLGVPVPCSFEIYTYGPYSDAVTFAVDSLLADDVLKDMSKDPQTYSNYRLGENANEILNAYQPFIDPHRAKIDAVVQSLGNFKPQELELIATLHFIHHRLRQIWRKEPSRDQIVAEFHRVKKNKFTREKIDSWYDALKGANLI